MKETGLFYFFIDQKLIQSQIRPQRRNWCSVASVATAFNRLFGVRLTQEQIFRICPVNKLRTRSRKTRKWVYPGNAKVVGLFNLLCQAYRVSGIAMMAKDRSWSSITSAVLHSNTVLIYHMTGHYACIAGIYENAKEKFFIISDSSTGSRDRRTGHHNRILKGFPLWCISYEDIISDLSRGTNKGLILCRR